MARLQRNQRPLDWLSGRVTVEEIMAAQADTALPPRDPRQPHLGLSTGPLADRRTTKLPAPAPRIRPPDLEARASGLALYGARVAVPWPYRDVNVLGSGNSDAIGNLAFYQLPDELIAARARVIVNRSAASVGLVVQVCLVRNGIDNILRILANADYESQEPITLLRGDALRVHVTTIGAAGAVVTALISLEERA